MKAQAAVQSARVYLNDVNGITWSDALLFPFLQEAHAELVQELDRYGSGTLKFQTGPVLVPAGTLVHPSPPTNILNPVEMLEGTVGSDPSSFERMIKVTYLPYKDIDSYLTYWAWLNETITFVGATQDRAVVLRYEGNLATPQSLNDTLGVLYAERYLGPRIAAMAYASARQDNKYLLALADSALNKIIQVQVTNDQRPVRRRPYRSRKGMFLGGTSVIAGGGGSTTPSGGTVNWVDPTNAPNGVITAFVFNKPPKFMLWNGLILFQGTGYTMVAGGGTWTVTFIDPDGIPLAPATGDVVKGSV